MARREPSDLEDGEFDFELRPGEHSAVPHEGAALRSARRFRDVLGRFPSGVAVVTGIDGDHPVGLTCQSFASVSLDPPLVLFCPARTSHSWPVIERSGAFAVNLLAHDQVVLARRMAVSGVDKFGGLAWRPAPGTGSPLLAGTLGYVDCRIHAVHDGGDHLVVLGEVVDLGANDPEHALTFYQGGYGSTAGRLPDDRS